MEQRTTNDVFLMTRGNDEARDIYEEDTIGLIPFVTGDTVEFMVKLNYTDANSAAIIHKTITTFTGGIAKLFLTAAETASLPFGRYCFDVKRSRQGGDKKTIVKGDFILDWEVNHG